MDIEDLKCQRIQVDDDNQPAPENSNPPVAGAAPPPGTWEKPIICPRHANSMFADNPESTLNFRKQLAKCMLLNQLGDNGVVPHSPFRPRVRRNIEHEQKKKLVGQGKWNSTTKNFNKVKTQYVCEKCSNCTATTREYCRCNPQRPLCRGCFTLYLEEHGG